MTGTGVLLCGILFCLWQRLVLVGFLEFLHGIIIGGDDVFFHGIILADMGERVQIDRLRLLLGSAVRKTQGSHALPGHEPPAGIAVDLPPAESASLLR